MDINLEHIFSQGITPGMLIEFLPKIAGFKKFIPQILALTDNCKEWEKSLGLAEGETVEYSAFCADKDALIFVCAVSQLPCHEEGYTIMKKRVIYKKRVSEFIALIDQYIPNV